MINEIILVELAFNGYKTVDKEIFVPFLVDEIRVLDTMYISAGPMQNPAELYTISSNLFDGVIIPVNNIDFYNFDPLHYYSPFNVTFTYKKNCSSIFTFSMNYYNTQIPQPLYNAALLLQFINYG